MWTSHVIVDLKERSRCNQLCKWMIQTAMSCRTEWIKKLLLALWGHNMKSEQRFAFRHIVLMGPVSVSRLVPQRTCWPRMQENVQSAWRSWCRETPSPGYPASASTTKGTDISRSPFTAPAALLHASEKHTPAHTCTSVCISQRVVPKLESLSEEVCFRASEVVVVVSLGKSPLRNRIHSAYVRQYS